MGVTEGSQAAGQPHLTPGLILQSIGDQDVSRMPYAAVIAAIKSHTERPITLAFVSQEETIGVSERETGDHLLLLIPLCSKLLLKVVKALQ